MSTMVKKGSVKLLVVACVLACLVGIFMPLTAFAAETAEAGGAGGVSGGGQTGGGGASRDDDGISLIVNTVSTGVKGVFDMASEAFQFLTSNDLCMFMFSITFAGIAIAFVGRSFKTARK